VGRRLADEALAGRTRVGAAAVAVRGTGR